MRTDPFYDASMWPRSGSGYAWSTHVPIRPGDTIIPGHRTARDPQAHLLTAKTADGQIKVLAVLAMWKIAMTEQVAALTGLSVPDTFRRLCELLDAGIIDVARNNAWLKDYSQPLVWAIRNNGLAGLRHRLTATELAVIDFGRPLPNVLRHERHAVLTTELGLRVAESHTFTVGSVFGELVGGSDQMFAQPKATTLADATIVREDGFRLAIELGAGSRMDDRKMQGWVANLSSRPAAEIGAAAVFVIAPRVEDYGWKSSLKDLHRTYMAAAEASSSVPVSWQRAALERLYYVRWDEWFTAGQTNELGRPAHDPTTARSTNAFAELRATRLCDGKTVSLLEAEYAMSDAVDWQAPNRNAARMLGVPAPLRDYLASAA